MGIDGGYEGWFLCLECHLRTRFTSKNLSFEFSANLCKSVQIVLKAIRLKSQWNTSKTPTCDSQCWQCVSRVSRFGAKNPSLGKAEKSVSHELQPQQFLLQILQSWNFGTLELSVCGKRWYMMIHLWILSVVNFIHTCAWSTWSTITSESPGPKMWRQSRLSPQRTAPILGTDSSDSDRLG